MNCPICKNVSLVMSERHGIEIDYCPQCRGVWLDRGELDKIIERSTGAPAAVAAPRYDSQPVPHYDNRGHDYDKRGQSHSHPQGHGQSYGQSGHYKKKREGFLADIFDFD